MHKYWVICAAPPPLRRLGVALQAPSEHSCITCCSCMGLPACSHMLQDRGTVINHRPPPSPLPGPLSSAARPSPTLPPAPRSVKVSVALSLCTSELHEVMMMNLKSMSLSALAVIHSTRAFSLCVRPPTALATTRCRQLLRTTRCRHNVTRSYSRSVKRQGTTAAVRMEAGGTSSPDSTSPVLGRGREVGRRNMSQR